MTSSQLPAWVPGSSWRGEGGAPPGAHFSPPLLTHNPNPGTRNEAHVQLPLEPLHGWQEFSRML